MGGSAHKAPRNVVYRSEGNPISAHKLAQWQGASSYQDPIYHAPPETRVHAHKQALQFINEHPEPPVPENTVPVSAVTEPVGTAGTFDFGGEAEYDYAAL